MDVIADFIGISESTLLKILASLITVIVLLVGRALVLRSVRKRFEETWVGYRARKVATYVVTIVGLSAMAFIWIDAFNDLPTFLGLLSAGVAIALADVLKNMAGWIYILSRRPFRVGDRIEIGGTKGDVVDIRLFRFSLMEVGNWVDAEQSTGRLVHVPNGLLFGEQVANYTEGFEYIWQEIPVLVTFESNRDEARDIVTRAVTAHAPDIEHIAGKTIRQTAEVYHIKFGPLTPIVYLSVEDSGVLFTARFLVPARRQRDIGAAIWGAVLDGIDKTPNVELAYPTIRTFFAGPVALRHDDAGPAEKG